MNLMNVSDFCVRLRLRGHATAIEDWELRRSAWKDLSKQALKKGTAPPDRPPDAPPAPVLGRLVVNDATFEAMHQTMSENPAGILVIRDELTGWWTQLDRAGREGDANWISQVSNDSKPGRPSNRFQVNPRVSK